MSESQCLPPQDEQQAVYNQTLVKLDSDPILRFAQLGLRLLGVFFVVSGLSAVVGGLVQGFLRAKAYAVVGYGAPIDPDAVSWVASGIPYIAAGLYFTVGGNWILLKVFAAAGRSAVEDEEAGHLSQ